MAKPLKKNPYSVHPGVKMIQDWIATLKEKSGRSLPEWIALSKKSGPKEQKALQAWLKETHGLGVNAAWWIAERVFPKPLGLGDDDPARYLASAPKYVDAQFQGKKAALRPLYDALLSEALALGPDVRACPCETIVPLYRTHVFAQLKATTNTRLDLGLALAKYEGALPARLIDTGGLAKKDRITHRVEFAAGDSIDAFTKRWLRVAYDLDFKPLKAAARAKVETTAPPAAAPKRTRKPPASASALAGGGAKRRAPKPR
jgi:hypothetical protein